MVFSWSFTIPLVYFTSCVFGMRSDTTIIPECKDWEEQMPDKWKAKAGIVTKNRKVYLDENPDPCSQYGLQCCKGKCLLEGCQALECKKCDRKLSKVPKDFKKEICQDTTVCHDTVKGDIRGCAFHVGKCGSAKYSCDRCNLFFPANEASTLNEVSKARSHCEDPDVCYQPGNAHTRADGWCKWNSANLRCENGGR